MLLYVWPSVEVPLDELLDVTQTLAPITAGLGLEEVLIEARVPAPPDGELRDLAFGFSYQPGVGVTFAVAEPPTEPLPTLDEYAQKVLRARRRGAVYPYELVPLLTRAGGTFTEHDLDDDGRLVPVERPVGGNSAGIVVGVVRTITDRYPEGMVRVALLGDPTKALGSIAEPECVRIMRGARPRRADGRARRVVRAVGRGEDLDGQRHREHGLGRPRAAPPGHVHAGAAARSTWSWPASTSAPSRTGTPRRRC